MIGGDIQGGDSFFEDFCHASGIFGGEKGRETIASLVESACRQPYGGLRADL